MLRWRRVAVVGVFLAVALLASEHSDAQDSPDRNGPPVASPIVERWHQLISERGLSETREYFHSELKKNQNDDGLRALLGLTQCFEAIEQLGQSWYRFGIRQESLLDFMPLFRLPIPTSEHPEVVAYEDVRKALMSVLEKLGESQKTLDGVRSESLKMHLKLGLVRFDWNSDGSRVSEESFAQVMKELSPPAVATIGEDLAIGVDAADVVWLRGYTHVLQAIIEVVLAYDERELFEHCGHLVFTKIKSPYLLTHQQADLRSWELNNVMDYIAFIHLMHFKVKEPERMKSAHGHLLVMVRESREFWRLAIAETDDDHEWLPNPKQKGVLQIPIRPEMVSSWAKVLDEMEAMLEGQKLIPYWRVYLNRNQNGVTETPPEGKGINLKRVFFEPKTLDLVLIFQGASWEEYMEDGPLSTPEAWNRLTAAFGGRFFGFATWFN